MFFLLILLLLVWIARKYLVGKRYVKKSIGFFHPYANDGGGGERVLWTAIDSILNDDRYKEYVCVVFMNVVEGKKEDEVEKLIQDKVKNVFGLSINTFDRIIFIYLEKKKWVEASSYPHFTMIGQSLGSLILAFEALTQLIPEIYCDSMGYAFTYPLARFLGCKVMCYTHYPTISSDMLGAVYERQSGSIIWKTIKIIYYYFLTFAYGFVGSFAQVVMVNSSWTRDHIRKLWGRSGSIIERVYPPCDTENLSKIPFDTSGREKIILSIAQFRPEKDHKKQIEAFSLFLQKLGNNGHSKNDINDFSLILVGGCRSEEDAARVEELKQLCIEKKLEVDKQVKFIVNAKYSEILSLLSKATVGIHTMWNEHFGINIVEFMAAGVIALAHNSAGPQMDIVGEESLKRGFLATSAEEYADQLYKIFHLTLKEREAIQRNARDHATTAFSVHNFQTAFKSQLDKLIGHR